MDGDTKIAIITGICAILGSTLGSSIPYLYLSVTTPHATDWIARGNDYYLFEEFDNALFCYNNAIELDLRSETAWRQKGLTLIALANYTDAIKVLDNAIKLDSQDPATWHYKGDAYSHTSNIQDAIEAYNESLDLNPRDAEVWADKGNILKNIGNYDEALQAYNSSLKLNPKDAKVLTAKGDVLAILGRNKEAISNYNLSINYDKVIIKSASVSPAVGRYTNRFEYRTLAYLPPESSISLEIKESSDSPWKKETPLKRGTGGWAQYSWFYEYPSSDFKLALYRFVVITKDENTYSSPIFMGPANNESTHT